MIFSFAFLVFNTFLLGYNGFKDLKKRKIDIRLIYIMAGYLLFFAALNLFYNFVDVYSFAFSFCFGALMYFMMKRSESMAQADIDLLAIVVIGLSLVSSVMVWFFLIFLLFFFGVSYYLKQKYPKLNKRLPGAFVMFSGYLIAFLIGLVLNSIVDSSYSLEACIAVLQTVI